VTERAFKFAYNWVCRCEMQVCSVYGWSESHWFPQCSSVWLAISV